MSALRERVRHVKTPRFSLKFHRSVCAGLERLHRLGEQADARPALAPRPPAADRPHKCLRCGQQLDSLREQIERLSIVPVETAGTVQEALERTLAEAGEDELILTTGSLYLVGEARGYWYPTADLLRDSELGAAV